MDYPFLITFNGDDFDLRYLKHRAMRKEIGIKEEEIPIALQRQEASLKHGVHIDLYRFFNNRSIQVYVYNNRYTEHTLNGISEALLGKEKFSFEGNIGELPLVKLADYCLNDSQLTYELTSAERLAHHEDSPGHREDRQDADERRRRGWASPTGSRSMLFYDHRRIGALIPRHGRAQAEGRGLLRGDNQGEEVQGRAGHRAQARDLLRGLGPRLCEPLPEHHQGPQPLLRDGELHPRGLQDEQGPRHRPLGMPKAQRDREPPDRLSARPARRPLQGARQGQDAPEGEQRPLQHRHPGAQGDPQRLIRGHGLRDVRPLLPPCGRRNRRAGKGRDHEDHRKVQARRRVRHLY